MIFSSVPLFLKIKCSPVSDLVTWQTALFMVTLRNNLLSEVFNHYFYFEFFQPQCTKQELTKILILHRLVIAFKNTIFNFFIMVRSFRVIFRLQLRVVRLLDNTALIWQKEASDKSDISRKRAKCVCHLHWRQWNIMMSYLTYLLVGWVFLHEIWPGRRAPYVNYENINNSNLDGMSLASFCQSRAE